jgi:membrane fusion protein (multidrug efflux system)
VCDLRTIAVCLAVVCLGLSSATAQELRVSSDETARGIVVSQHEATLGSELVARIAALPFAPGQRFNKGDVLVSFDCERYAAELAAARAEQEAAELTLSENRELRRHRAVGATELKVSRARLVKAKAQADALEIRMSQCKLYAPFSGRVVKHFVNAFEIPRANEPLISIVDDANLEIDLLVRSKWLAWLRAGTTFGFQIDELGRVFPAEVFSVGAAVDPVSQTIRLKARFKTTDPAILPGMSGSATFQKSAAERRDPQSRLR